MLISFCLFFCLSLFLSVSLSVCLSFCLSLFLSVSLSVCLSLCLLLDSFRLCFFSLFVHICATLLLYSTFQQSFIKLLSKCFFFLDFETFHSLKRLFVEEDNAIWKPKIMNVNWTLNKVVLTFCNLMDFLYSKIQKLLYDFKKPEQMD
jgi:hypothetical protein